MRTVQTLHETLPGASEKNDHPHDTAMTHLKPRAPNVNVDVASFQNSNGDGRFHRDGETPPLTNASTLKFGGGVAKLTSYLADGRFFRSHRSYVSTQNLCSQRQTPLQRCVKYAEPFPVSRANKHGYVRYTLNRCTHTLCRKEIEQRCVLQYIQG